MDTTPVSNVAARTHSIGAVLWRSVRPSQFRAEIQALRALAVLLVVLNHLWPAELKGGFVGVDVFFVISGYLITSHLMKELRARRTIDVVAFWARRIRRLLPAAFLVLAASLVLVMLALPPSMWTTNLTQIVASAFYAENWVLTADSVNYFAAENAASAVQHYWSLSVEEQFYIVWPLVLSAAAYVMARGARRRRVRGGRRAAATSRAPLVVVTAFAIASFLVCMLQSYGPAPQTAYFSTAVRAWEFMLGALLVVMPGLAEGQLPTAWKRRRIASGWIGLALIAASAVLLSGSDPFPGVLALLPTSGAVLVLLGGTPPSRLSLTPIASLRPVQYLGDISYSVYLWHWPLIVAFPYLLIPFGGFSLAWHVAILPLTFVLAALTKRFIEDRFRRARSRSSARSTTRRAFLTPVVGTGLLLTAVLVIAQFYIVPTDEAQAARVKALNASGCLGAAAISNDCSDPFGYRDTVSPLVAAGDKVPVCAKGIGTTPNPELTAATCVYGDIETRPSLAIIGDSHAQVMGYYLGSWALKNGYAVQEFTASSCPSIVTKAELTFPNEMSAISARSAGAWDDCAGYATKALDEVEHSPRISTVFLTNATRSYVDEKHPDESIVTRSGVASTISQLTSAGKHVVVIRDDPGLDFGASAPTCVSTHLMDPQKCRVARTTALAPDDPMVAAASETATPVIDLSRDFCDRSWCYGVVGGVIAYWDRAHLTKTMADTLRPQIDSALEKTVGTIRRGPQGRSGSGAHPTVTPSTATASIG